MKNSERGSLAQARHYQAWWATLIIFLLHGLIAGTWLSRIPAVQTALRLNNAVLGLALLGSAVGAVLTAAFAGRLVNRYGSKHATVIGSIAFSLALILPGLAVNALTLSLALLAFGAAGATMDISMNAQGVEIERKLQRPTMSRFHAMFSTGAMAGTGIGGMFAAHHVRPVVQFACAALIYVIITAVIGRWLLEVPARHVVRAHRLPLNQIPAALLTLCAIAFCILLSENALADWTAVYLRQALDAKPGTAAAGYAVFSAMMAIFRFLGDMVTEWLGAARTVRTGAIVAAAGIGAALAAKSVAWALLGLAAGGAGFSVIIPLVFGSGGKVKSVSASAGIATVTGIGYSGYVVGPPLIGLVAHILSVRDALTIVVACCAVSAALSGFIDGLDKSGSSEAVTELSV